MTFAPNPHDELTIDGITHRLAEHPAAPGFPYGQEGRAGIVYCLEALTPTPRPGDLLPSLLPPGEGEGVTTQPPGEEVRAVVEASAEILAFMQAARRIEDQGNLEGTLELYRQALELARADPSLRSLAREIELTIQDVAKRAAATPALPPISPLPLGEGSGVRASPLPLGEGSGVRADSPLPLGEEPGVRVEPRRKPGWGFWLLWVLANAFGGIAGFVAGSVLSIGVGVGVALVSVVFAGHDASVLFSVVLTAVFLAVFGTALGTAIGYAQWLMLRQHVRKAGWWMLASAAGWTIWCLGIVVATALTNLNETASEVKVANAILVAATGAIGLVVGGSQWVVLRRRVRSAGWWILASMAGWAMVGYLLATQGVTIGIGGNQLDPITVDAASGLLPLVGGIVGANAMSSSLTGAVLVWLLRQPRPEETNASR